MTLKHDFMLLYIYNLMKNQYKIIFLRIGILTLSALIHNTCAII